MNSVAKYDVASTFEVLILVFCSLLSCLAINLMK